MKEKIEILRNLAESILDELAELEALTVEEAKIYEAVRGGVTDSR